MSAFSSTGGSEERRLLARGADLTIRDDDYDAPAAGWANHFGNKEIEALLLDVAKESGG